MKITALVLCTLTLALALPNQATKAAEAPISAPTIVGDAAVAPPPPIPAITNVGSLFPFMLNLLPSWDRSISNGPASFHANELEISASMAWKSATASGLTPYGNVGGEYYPWLNFGFGGDLTLFNSGDGSSEADSAALTIIPRVCAGNVAGYLLAGVCRDFHAGKFGGEAGAGVEYRYNTGLGLRLDTVYRAFGQKDLDGFLTRLGLSVHF